MRVTELRLSNILSFKYEADINNAFSITFDPTLNIIIGGNGSGKSTALEAINFIFSRVIFKHYDFHQNNFVDPRAQQKKATIMVAQQASRLSPYRLQPNWQTESEVQMIRVVVALDDIDKANMQNVVDNYDTISAIVGQYSSASMPGFSPIAGGDSVELSVHFSSSDDSYSVTYNAGVPEHVKFYLENYMLLHEAILISNKLDPESHLGTLSNTFSMLPAFRNYTSFSLNTSIQSDPQEQLRSIRSGNASRSNNQQSGEPSIFNLVKLRLGEHHQGLTLGKDSVEDATAKVNNSGLVTNINKKLEILDLKFSIQPTDVRSWSYEFKFTDTKHDRDMGDINSLSAGQKSIVHLIFEAYGQDTMKGGVVIIDEPEIHLHYQFQYEYLRILEELTVEQKTQYIIVTHSEGFISSNTATYIKRFALNGDRHSTIFSPSLSSSQNKLIEILDNTQASRALFANKVVLVEGQDDEYFFRAVLKSLRPELRQEIAIYNTHSKDSIDSWRAFFDAFGVSTYFIKDLDATGKDFYAANESFKPDDPSKMAPPLKDTATKIAEYKARHSDLISKIDAEYANKGFYLKLGAIEQYTDSPKGIKHVINFCENIDLFLSSASDESAEIIAITEKIAETSA